MNTVPETLDAAGAQALKAKIINYWKARGFREPKIFIVRAPCLSESQARYDVRSNMTGGWPNGGLT
jgi:hypothetical protein